MGSTSESILPASAIFNYAKGDIKSKIWFFPGKGITSHNIKALMVVLRYALGIILLLYSIKHPVLLPFLLILFFAYLVWAFRKLYLEFGEIKVALWGTILQPASDLAVIRGVIEGFLSQPKFVLK